MTKKILVCMFIFLYISVWSQEIIRADSVALFRTGSDYNCNDQGIRKSKGVMPEVRIDTTSGFVINMFNKLTYGFSLNTLNAKDLKAFYMKF